jgi:hypothetical protein
MYGLNVSNLVNVVVTHASAGIINFFNASVTRGGFLNGARLL